jgi:hypothetical protein
LRLVHVISAMDACQSYKPWHGKASVLRIETASNDVSFVPALIPVVLTGRRAQLHGGARHRR